MPHAYNHILSHSLTILHHPLLFQRRNRCSPSSNRWRSTSFPGFKCGIYYLYIIVTIIINNLTACSYLSLSLAYSETNKIQTNKFHFSSKAVVVGLAIANLTFMTKWHANSETTTEYYWVHRETGDPSQPFLLKSSVARSNVQITEVAVASWAN